MYKTIILVYSILDKQQKALSPLDFIYIEFTLNLVIE